MKDKRIGNDINVIWTLVREEGNYTLDGRDVSLYLKNMFGRKKITDFLVSGNQVFWTFYGKDQKHTGIYSLELVINEGDRGMITTDACNFVNLVNCSCKTGGAPEPNVQIETIELTSTLEYINYDDTELRERVEDLEEKKADKDDLANLATKAELNEKQDTLESGVNIKTINNQSILGEGNITIEGGSGKPYDDTEIKNQLSELEIEVSKKLESEVVVDTESTEDFEFGYDDTEIRQEIAGLSEEVGKKQDTISDLETIRSGAAKGATAIQEVKTINGQSIVGSGNIEIQGGGGGGMTTPSGDPMHYMFEAAGASYNATDADIPMVGIYGDSYVHKAKHWHLNELGDITNEEMRAIYVESNPMVRRINLEHAFAGGSIRTNIAIWDANRNTTYGQIALTSVELRGVCGWSQIEVFSFILGPLNMNLQKHMPMSTSALSYSFIQASKLSKIIGCLNCENTTDSNTFKEAKLLKEVRLIKIKKSFSFDASPLLSKNSVLFAIQNSVATSAITITLHADAYARLAEDADIVAALAEKEFVSLASA